MKQIKSWTNFPSTLSIYESEVCIKLIQENDIQRQDQYSLATFLKLDVHSSYDSHLNKKVLSKFIEQMTETGIAEIQSGAFQLKLEPSLVSVGEISSGRFSGDVGASFSLEEFVSGHFQDWVMEKFGLEILNESIICCRELIETRTQLLKEGIHER